MCLRLRSFHVARAGEFAQDLQFTHLREATPTTSAALRFVCAAPQTALCVAWRNRCHQGALSLVPALESSPNSQHTYT